MAGTRPARTDDGRTVRVSLLCSEPGMDDARRAAVLATVLGQHHDPDLRRAPAASGSRKGPLGFVLELALHRPEVVIAGAGRAALAAGLYRAVSRQAALLVLLSDPAAARGPLQRVLLRMADGVLLDGTAAEHALAGGAVRPRAAFRLPPPAVRHAFAVAGGVRTGAAARRLVVATELSPRSGSADLLSALITWADHHPEDTAAIDWIGEGDLVGILAAQPLPPNLTQRFLGRITVERTAVAFAGRDILVVMSGADGDATVAEAMAAGLAVVGNCRNPAVRQHVVEGVTGWLFDPHEPTGLLQGLGRALQATAAERAEMSRRIRDMWQVQPPADILGRLRRRSRTVAASLALARAPGRAR